MAATAYAATGVSWVVEDIQALTFPAAAFDYVFSCETIEHLVDEAAAQVPCDLDLPGRTDAVPLTPEAADEACRTIRGGKAAT